MNESDVGKSNQGTEVTVISGFVLVTKNSCFGSVLAISRPLRQLHVRTLLRCSAFILSLSIGPVEPTLTDERHRQGVSVSLPIPFPPISLSWRRHNQYLSETKTKKDSRVSRRRQHSNWGLDLPSDDSLQLELPWFYICTFMIHILFFLQHLINQSPSFGFGSHPQYTLARDSRDKAEFWAHL